MILQALCELAQREGLTGDLDYEDHRVDFFVHLDGAGKLLGILAANGGDKLVRKMTRVPRLPTMRTGSVAPGVLFDTSAYALGVGVDKARKGFAAAKAEAFRALAEEVATTTGEPRVKAVAGFLGSLAEHMPAIVAAAPKKGWTGSEWVAFVVDEEFVHALPAVRAWWQARRAGEASPEAGEAAVRKVRCLVSGAMAAPLMKHPAIQGVPNTGTSGVPLLSFDKPSFTSREAVQGWNAPVSREAAEAYALGLGWLLERRPPDEHGRRHLRHGTMLGEDLYLFWAADGGVDDLAWFTEPSAEAPLALTRAPFSGVAPGEIDAAAYYGLVLRGTQGRIMVRSWITETVGGIKRHLGDWFAALGGGEPSPLRELIDAMQVRRGGGKPIPVRPEVQASLLRAALLGEPLTRELALTVVRRVELGAMSPDRWARCLALLRVFLRHAGRCEEVSVALDEERNDVPYVLGRLFAVMERLQWIAQGRVNVTMEDRYLVSMASTPVRAYEQMRVLSAKHEKKAGRKGWRTARLRDALVSRLDGIPVAMGLEDRALFHVGRDHQKESFRRVAPASGEVTQESPAPLAET